MNTQAFFDKYDGKPVDFDGVYGDQCVDIVMQFATEVLGIGRFGSGNAIGRWEDYPKDKFDRISNTPDAVPVLGDIIIWGKEVGEYGHIAISTGKVDQKNFNSFDQNWPIGSKCHYQKHDYKGVLGWLRFKQVNEAPMPDRFIEVKDHKVSETKVEGNGTIYQTYAIPSQEHFDALGNSYDDVREIPNWDGNPNESVKPFRIWQLVVEARAEASTATSNWNMTKQELTKVSDDLAVATKLNKDLQEQLNAKPPVDPPVYPDYSASELFAMFIRKVFKK